MVIILTMKAVIITIGSGGDVNPFIAIGQAMKRRGHEIIMLVNPYFKQQVLDAGLGYQPLGESFDINQIANTPEIMDKRKGLNFLLKNYLLPNVPIMIEAIEETIQLENPDIVVSHNLCLGVRWVCERYRIPIALIVLSPLLWFSREDAGLLRWWEPEKLPRWYLRLRHPAVRMTYRWMTDPVLNQIRKKYGYSRESNLVMNDISCCQVTLGLWSTCYRGSMSDDPPRSKICGFTWFDRHSELEANTYEVDKFLSDGDPPVVFTLGTSAVHLPGSFYKDAIETCKLLGRRGLLLTRNKSFESKLLPDGIRCFSYVPYSSVLRHGCATVHHGGIGTTAQAMRAGKPMVVVPFSHDQFDNAARVKRLGISVTVKQDKMSPITLSAALRSVLDNTIANEKSTAIERVLSNEDGAVIAAIALEEIVNKSTI